MLKTIIDRLAGELVNPIAPDHGAPVYILGNEEYANLRLDFDLNEAEFYFGAYWEGGNIEKNLTGAYAVVFNTVLLFGRKSDMQNFTPAMHEDRLLPVYRLAFQAIDRLNTVKDYPELYPGITLPDNMPFLQMYNAFDSNLDIVILTFDLRLKPPFDRCWNEPLSNE